MFHLLGRKSSPLFSSSSPYVAVQALPSGWVAFRDANSGRVYFMDLHSKRTTWDDPRPLPRYWEKKIQSSTGRPYFINHQTKSSSWKDPRPPIVESQIYRPNSNNSVNRSSSIPHNNNKQQIIQKTSSLPNNHANKPRSALPTRNDQKDDRDLPLPDYLRQNTAVPKRNVVQRTDSKGAFDEEKKELVLEQEKNTAIYEALLKWVIALKVVNHEEEEVLAKFRIKLHIDEMKHIKLLDKFGISLDDWDNMRIQQVKSSTSEKQASLVDECIICYDSTSCYIILDCMHLCLCKDCAHQLQKDNGVCPKCRKPIREVRRIKY